MPDSRYVMGPRSSNYVAKQATFGTRVAPEKEVWANGMTLTTQRPKYQLPTNESGSIAGRVDPGVRVGFSGAVTWPSPLDVNQAIMVMEACFGAATVTTPTGATNARHHTWVLDPTEGVSPSIYNFDVVERDGAAAQVVRRFAMADAICTGFTLAAPEGESPATLQSSWMANEPTEGVTTPALGAPPRLSPQIMPAAKGQLYIDDDWATMIGATPTDAADSFSFNLVHTSGVAPVQRENGSFAYDQMIAGTRSAQATVGIRKSTSATGLWRRELGKLDDLRYLLFDLQGGEIESGFNYGIKIGGAFYHDPNTIPDRGAPGDGGALRTNMVLSSAQGSDGTDPADLYIVITTDQISYP